MTLRTRSLDKNGDYLFGGPGIGRFLIDSPDAVAQIIRTRLLLFRGEFFLDDQAGTPWLQQIVGQHARQPPRPPEQNVNMIYDVAIKTVIAQTAGVSQILAYSSAFDGSARSLSIAAEVQTIFSNQAVSVLQSINLPTFVLGTTVFGA